MNWPRCWKNWKTRLDVQDVEDLREISESMYEGLATIRETHAKLREKTRNRGYQPSSSASSLAAFGSRQSSMSGSGRGKGKTRPNSSSCILEETVHVHPESFVTSSISIEQELRVKSHFFNSTRHQLPFPLSNHPHRPLDSDGHQRAPSLGCWAGGIRSGFRHSAGLQGSKRVTVENTDTFQQSATRVARRTPDSVKIQEIFDECTTAHNDLHRNRGFSPWQLLLEKTPTLNFS